MSSKNYNEKKERIEFNVSPEEREKLVRDFEDYNRRHSNKPITFEEYLKTRVFSGLGKMIDEQRRQGMDIDSKMRDQGNAQL